MQEWLSAAIEQFDFLPAWLIVVLKLTIAVVIGLSIHALVFHLLERRLRDSERFAWLLILRKSKGPSAMAVVIFAVIPTLQATEIGGATATMIIRALQVALVGLLAWIAIVIVQIFSVVYLRRFSIETDDNLLARKHVTQIRILKRAAITIIGVVGVAAALMSFDSVRQYGVSLFASAGVAGLAIGLAARPLLANLIAGIQIAVTQPIRIQDVVIVEGEYGTIEEITSTYVVVKLWDWRRMVLPLSYFIEQPFQNWTRETSSIIGEVKLSVDYGADVGAIRAKLDQIAKSNPLWDGTVVNLQVTDATENTIQLRALVSARNASAAFDLRCDVRERLIGFIQQQGPQWLPRQRQQFTSDRDGQVSLAPDLHSELREAAQSR